MAILDPCCASAEHFQRLCRSLRHPDQYQWSLVVHKSPHKLMLWRPHAKGEQKQTDCYQDWPAE